jgi:hypothetical protein
VKRKVRRQHSSEVTFGGSPSSEHPYFSVEFRQKLHLLGYQKLINADRVQRTDGGRFPRDVAETPIFQAISSLREYRLHFKNIDDFAIKLAPIDQKAAKILARYVIDAVRSDDPVSALEDLIALIRMESKSSSDKRVWENQKFIPWPYYAANSALYYLDKGVLPTRAQVQEGAIRHRVFDELFTSKVTVRGGSAFGDRRLVNAKFEDVTGYKQPKNWRRIFRELGLTELL